MKPDSLVRQTGASGGGERRCSAMQCTDNEALQVIKLAEEEDADCACPGSLLVKTLANHDTCSDSLLRRSMCRASRHDAVDRRLLPPISTRKPTVVVWQQRQQQQPGIVPVRTVRTGLHVTCSRDDALPGPWNQGSSPCRAA